VNYCEVSEKCSRGLSSQTLKSVPPQNTMGMDGSCIETTARCRALLVAMMSQLIDETTGRGVVNEGGAEGERLRENLKWDALLFILDDSPAPFSFLWICEALDIDAEAFRKGAKAGTLTSFKWV